MDSIGDPIARPLSTAPAGIYNGKRISTSNNQTLDVIALVDGKGNLRVSSMDGTELYAGAYTTNGSNLAIAALRYTPTPPSTDPGADPSVTPPQTTTSINASGSFDTNNDVQLAYTASDGDLGQFQLSYQSKQYETRSNLTLLAGSWGAKDTHGFATVKFTIDNSGGISGKDYSSSCNYSGQLSIIDIHYNLYNLSLSRQCAAVTTDTTGLATLLTPATGDQQLVFITAAPAVAATPAVAMLLDLDPL